MKRRKDSTEAFNEDEIDKLLEMSAKYVPLRRKCRRSKAGPYGRPPKSTRKLAKLAEGTKLPVLNTNRDQHKQLILRRALLPYLDDFISTSLSLSNGERPVGGQILDDFASRAWDKSTSVQEESTTIEMSVDESKGVLESTTARRRLLQIPSDSEVLLDCARELYKSHLAKIERDEGKKVGLLANDTPVSNRFPRFCELTRVDERQSCDQQCFRGPAWLLCTIEEIYDTLAMAYGTGRPRQAASPRTTRAPDVVSSYFWRHFGNLAPMCASSLLRELSRASMSECADALLFESFLNESRDEEPLAVVLCARDFLETVYGLSLRRVSQRAINGADGRFGQQGTLPRKEEAPMLVKHSVFSNKILGDAQSPLFDPHILSVLIPRAATARLAKFLMGGRREIERAFRDELGARGLSALSSEADRASCQETSSESLARLLVAKLECDFLRSSGRPLFSRLPTDAIPAFPVVKDEYERLHSREFALNEDLFQALADLTSSAQEDLIAFIKYNDNGERFEMVEALQQTLSDASVAEELCQSLKDAENEVSSTNKKLHQAKVRLERLQRQKASTTSAKTKVLLAQCEVKRAVALCAERRSRVEGIETRIDLTWKTMLESSSTCKVGKDREDLGSSQVHLALRVLRACVARESLKRSSDQPRLRNKKSKHQVSATVTYEENVPEGIPPLFGTYNEEIYALDEHTTMLEPLVRLQNKSAKRVQKLVRGFIRARRARRVAELERTKEEGISCTQFETNEEKGTEEDREIAVNRDLIRIAHLRKSEREATEFMAEAQETLMQKIREDEVSRRVAWKIKESMRIHLHAWSKLGRARRYSLGHNGRLARTILSSWNRKVRKEMFERKCATFLQSKLRQFGARLEMRRRRVLATRTMNAALACYGRASQRRLHRTLGEWHRWARLNVKSKAMALAYHSGFSRKILVSWYTWTKLEGSKRHHVAHAIKRAIHTVLAVKTTEFREQQLRLAATLFAAEWCGQRYNRFIYGIRAGIEQKAQELQREKAAIDFRSKLMRKNKSKALGVWRHSTRKYAIACAHDSKRILRLATRMWRQSTQVRIVEHFYIASCTSLVCRIVHGFSVRRRFARLIHPYRAARTIQTNIARPLLARMHVALVRELHTGVILIQRWRRGTLGRRRARSENMKQLFIAAYVDDSDALIRRHTAAMTLSSLASTRATVARHEAAGDLAIHRAARGVSVGAVQVCLCTLGIKANALNGANNSPLHVLGEILDPPVSALKEIAERKRQRQDEIDLFMNVEKSLSSSSVSKKPTAEEGVLAYSSQTLPGKREKWEEDDKEASPLVTSDIFKEWFHEGIPTKANALQVLGTIQQHQQDETESQALSISSETSEREVELALMSNSELNTLLSQDERAGEIIDLLLSQGASLEALDDLGRTPLLRAIDRGNVELVKVFLDRGARTDATDYAGNTPLTLAAQRGYVSIGRLVLRSGADANHAGRKGRTAMHEVCRLAHHTFASRFARSLLASGVLLDVPDEAGRTPFAYCVSCRHRRKLNAAELRRQIDGELSGAPEQLLLQLLLESGVDPGETYEDGSTALHLAARANRVDAVSAIIDYGDVDVSAKDASGETALHIAARSGASHTLKALLRRGSDLCACDNDGNQPIHAACLGGHLETIETLVAYDAPLGCRNWKGLTPVGVSRMHCKHMVTRYLLSTISSSSLGIVGDDSDSTDLVASWSQPIDSAASQWRQEWSGAEGLSTPRWIHSVTGECRLLPPPDRASRVVELSRKAWPKTVLQRELVVVRDDDAELTVGSAEYEKERSEHEMNVVQMRRERDAAIVMQTRWRRLDAINLAAWSRARRDAARKIQRWSRWKLAESARLVEEKIHKGVVVVQALFRGQDVRRDFVGFLWERLWWRRAERILAEKMQRLWRGHVTRRFLTRVRMQSTGPKSYTEWQNVVRASGAKPLRTFGIYEERKFPSRLGSSSQGVHGKIRFYRNRITGVCSWDKPSDWIAFDREAFEEREQLRLLGFTKKEADAAARLQAIWKGRKERENLRSTLLGARVMRRCESEYLENPKDLRKMAHYVLFLHVMQEDVERARPLYHHAIQQMQHRGPDDAWLLCSYAVFLAAMGEDDWDTIVDLAEKGRKARDGPEGGGDRRSYELAKGGFFRSATAQNPKSGWAWHNYALVLHLVYRDMSGAEENYVRAVLADSRNKVIQQNFGRLLEDRGSTLTCYDAIREYSTKEMLRDAALKKKQLDRMIKDPRMQEMAVRVQMSWRRREFRKLVFERAGISKEREKSEETRFSLSKITDAAAEAAAVTSENEEDASSSVGTSSGVFRWEICETSDGRNYYYDTTNGVSQWHEPESIDELVRESSVTLHPDS